MTDLQNMMPHQADNFIHSNFPKDLRARLTRQKNRGRTGWNTVYCSDSELLTLLFKNLGEEDYMDVAALAIMLHYRQKEGVISHE